ncbi:MAG: hypothetical protein LBK95_15735 [Bifidobacteriaceae bacterium]|jgi:hypothetical protein|nr:hypothetical protein [Bifidobacteriaceae bacterium]
MHLPAPNSRDRRQASVKAAVLIAALAALGLSACGQNPEASPSASPSPSLEPTAEPDEHVESDAAELAAPAPRLTITYEGGLQVIDALSLELVADLPLDGFNRVNPAGDERHVFVSTEGGFKLLDTGVFAVAHGDHAHYYAADPVLEDGLAVQAAAPGHVVPHDDLTTLFDDATGHVTVLEADDLGEPVRQYDSPAAHHGVAVALPDGTLVASRGTEAERTGIVVLDGSDAQVAESDQCPGIHGEAVAADEAVGFGCEGGAIIYADGAITFAPAPAPEGRISTMAGNEASPVLLGNYAVTGSEAPATSVSLVDTATATVRALDLGTPYAGFAITDDAAGLVLGTDGKLHVLDLAAGVETASYQIIDPFELPEDWQAPRPRLAVLEGMVYITDPSAKAIHVVDPSDGQIWKSGALSVVPNEIAGVTGEGAGEHDHDHGDEDHDEDHDDD